MTDVRHDAESVSDGTSRPVSPRREPSFEEAYREQGLEAVAALYDRPRTKDGAWLGISRALARALGRPAPVDPATRPEAVGADLAPATVFLLGATDHDPPGCLGHVSARAPRWSVGGRGTGSSEAEIHGGGEIVQSVLAAILEAVRPLAPDAFPPEHEITIPYPGEGGSHALATGIAAMHALLRCRVPPGIAATGGIAPTQSSDPGDLRFAPVPPETMAAKIAAARRWGIQRILVVSGQTFPADTSTEDLRIVEVSPDPAALPLLVLDLLDGDTPATDATRAWRQALALYDIRVARSPREPLEAVMAATAPFAEPVASRLDLATLPSRESVHEAWEASDIDPILVGLAADVRSRVLLHAGRTVESSWWDAIAVGLRGLGDLPEGLLGDHLQFQQPSHRSMIAIDLGDLDDAGEDAHPHRRLDSAIEHLERGWCTTHQTLLAMFASNTRWRRRLYLARRELDRERLLEAEHDLLHWSPRWEELLDRHARHGLGMSDTDLRRQWNYVLEHAVTDVSLLDPEGYASGTVVSSIRESVLGRFESLPGLEEDLAARAIEAEANGAISAFDLRGLLQWRWLRGVETCSPTLRNTLRACITDPSAGPIAGVAEWWHRTSDVADPDLAIVHDALRRSLEGHLQSDAAEDAPAGIRRLVGLRRAALLDADDVRPPDGASDWVSAVRPPDGPATLRHLFDELRSRPEVLAVRTPY